LSAFCRIDHPSYVSLCEIRRSERGHLSIYALVDPRDMTVRYIGKTNDPVARLLEHIEDPHVNWPLRDWLADLAELEFIPELVVLQMCDEVSWNDAEISWVSLARGLGRIYNIADGGITRGKARRLKRKRESRSLRRSLPVAAPEIVLDDDPDARPIGWLDGRLVRR